MKYKNTNQLITKSLSICLLCICFAYQSHAQLVTTQVGATDADVLVNLLLGENVSFSNATLTTDSLGQAAGSFAGGGDTNIGLDRGVLLTSGSVHVAVGPNDLPGDGVNNGAPGDPAIDNSLDATVLQFDFMPTETTLSFRYVFASEEYPEFACTHFNDAFGFFLTGSNPNGPDYNAENIALLPGDDFVSIRNVNDRECVDGEENNVDLYISNPEDPNTTIQYDGFTTVLTIQADVVACQSYTIRLVIADRTDRRYDSAVFLEEGSFTATDPQVADFIFRDDTGEAQSQFCFGEPVLLDATASEVSESWLFEIGEYNIGGFAANEVPRNNCVTDTRTDALGVLDMAALWASCSIPGEEPNELDSGFEYVVTLVLTDECGNEEILTQIFSFVCCESEEFCTANFHLNTIENPNNTVTASTANVDASNNPWSQSNWFLFTHEERGEGPYTAVTSVSSENFEFEAEFGICYTLIHQVVSDCGTCCYFREICENASGKMEVFESDEIDDFKCQDLDLGFCNLATPSLLGCESDGEAVRLVWEAVPNAESYLVDVFVNDPTCCEYQGPGIPFPGGTGDGTQMEVQYETTTNSVLTEIKDGSCFSWQVTAICNESGNTTTSERICTSGLCRPDFGDGGEKSSVQFSDDQIEVYPNPSSDVVNFSVSMMKASSAANINIYDTNYRLVETITDFNHAGNLISGKWQIDSRISNGVYILKVTLDHVIITKKILVVK